MNTKRQYQKRYALLLLLSLLIHLAAYLGYLASRESIEPVPVQPARVVIQLSQPPESDQTEFEELQEERPELPEEELIEERVEDVVKEETHAPVDNSDRFASDNQDDSSATEIVARESSPVETPLPEPLDPAQQELPELSEQQVELEQQELAAGKQIKGPDAGTDDTTSAIKSGLRPDESLVTDRETITSSSDQAPELLSGTAVDAPAQDEQDKLASGKDAGQDLPDALAALSISPDDLLSESQEAVPVPEVPPEFLNRFGNLELLSDQGLREADVPHPFSEEQSRELELANKYLERMNKQVREVWVNPYKGGRMYRGIIKVELDVRGYLEDVYVYRASGLASLDTSVIRAIESIPRFLVPDDEIIAARYYTRMSFHYSSIEAKTELLPFEVELAKKEDS